LVQAKEPRPWRPLDEDAPDSRQAGDWSGVHAGLGLLIAGLVVYLLCQFAGMVPGTKHRSLRQVQRGQHGGHLPGTRNVSRRKILRY
jgi:hypothetical protein